MKSLLALVFAWLAFVATPAQAADKPYDEAADAKADIQKALTKADADHKSVLVIFGANWCPDCRVLDANLKQPGPTADLVAKDYEVVKVDLGNYNHNLDVATTYGVNIKKGIPTLALLSAKGEVMFVTKDSELADARHMGDDGIQHFFEKLSAKYPAKP